MRLFSTSRTFTCSEPFISFAIDRIRKSFEGCGYRFSVKSQSLDRTVVEIQRGNVLHQVVGLRHGVEIIFTKSQEGVSVETKACLLENHIAGPAIIAMAIPELRVPLAITDGLGLVLDFGLDEEAMGVIEDAYAEFSGDPVVFCTHCGAPIHNANDICDKCGHSSVSEVLPAIC